ncbi:hypothetical protein [Streptomyces albipurpureus]|uniref:Uncharacterized protein n=1 Tax=Streptomyces albipurpureus TaxID=2897419 RepID=A0ABT0USX4_9ACTN|nr:hypothetical protein [Streptomyces sp. CWNU-1]MCM2391699.1 hypothetical protein [Streptomyces sp. CWNU-1]
MSDVHKIHSFDAVWQPGDVVLAADGALYIRASQNPMYPWGDASQSLGQHVEGGVADGDVVRPLILLVRDGVTLGGRLIHEGDIPAIT